MRRRDFLKTAGLAAACLALPLPARAAGEKAAGFGPSPAALTAKRWGMVIDSRQLASPALMDAVTRACHSWHNVPALSGPQEVKWIWAAPYPAAFPDQALDLPPESLARRPFALLCNHCENPPCVRVCPTKATFKRPDGIVVMDYHRCIGCRSCMSGCPYGARSFNYTDPQSFVARPCLEYPMRTRGVVEKCSFCAERLDLGKPPLCVEAAAGAILFGNLADENSAVRKALAAAVSFRRSPSLGTGPSVYYIV